MDDLVLKFCEDRRSWLFVIAGTLGLVLVLLMPAVDDYGAVCDESEDLSDQLAHAKESVQFATQYEKKLDEQRTQLQSVRGETLSEDNEAEFRNSVVRMVREAGCQLRRINIGSPQSQAWDAELSVLERPTSKRSKEPSPYNLEKRVVTLSLAGPTANVKKLMERFESSNKSVHVEQIDMRPNGQGGRRIELSLELWYFAIERAITG